MSSSSPIPRRPFVSVPERTSRTENPVAGPQIHRKLAAWRPECFDALHTKKVSLKLARINCVDVATALARFNPKSAYCGSRLAPYKHAVRSGERAGRAGVGAAILPLRTSNS